MDAFAGVLQASVKNGLIVGERVWYIEPSFPNGAVAQLVEHHVRNVGVGSSNLLRSTMPARMIFAARQVVPKTWEKKAGFRGGIFFGQVVVSVLAFGVRMRYHATTCWIRSVTTHAGFASARLSSTKSCVSRLAVPVNLSMAAKE